MKTRTTMEFAIWEKFNYLHVAFKYIISFYFNNLINFFRLYMNTVNCYAISINISKEICIAFIPMCCIWHTFAITVNSPIKSFTISPSNAL